MSDSCTHTGFPVVDCPGCSSPPAAPTAAPCECGHGYDSEQLTRCHDCGRLLPSAPPATTPGEPDHPHLRCDECGATEYDLSLLARWHQGCQRSGVLRLVVAPSRAPASGMTPEPMSEDADGALERMHEWDARPDDGDADADYRDVRAELSRLRAAQPRDWRTMCLVEIAAENPSVSDYVDHWEGRCLKAEAEVERLRAAQQEGAQ